MKVTDIKFFPVKNKDSKIKAFSSITFDKALCVTGIKVIEGEKGTFIGFPSQQGSDGDYHDIVFPVTKEAREGLTKKILEAYNKQDQSGTGEDIPFS